MMQHSFNPWNSTRVEKIPVATCVAVVAPVCESRRVAADAGESFGCEGGGVEVSVVEVKERERGERDGGGGHTLTKNKPLLDQYYPKTFRFQKVQIAPTS